MKKPPAKINAVVRGTEFDQIEVTVHSDAEEVFGAEDLEEAAREILLREFEEVVTISGII